MTYVFIRKGEDTDTGEDDHMQMEAGLRAVLPQAKGPPWPQKLEEARKDYSSDTSKGGRPCLWVAYFWLP